ncbi:MAG: hypothetical protein AMXMBFR77_27710 [Phycisphaerales bacterium]
MNLEAYRVAHNLTYAALGVLLGVRRSVAFRWCQRTRRPRPDAAAAVMAATGGQVTVEEQLFPWGMRAGARFSTPDGGIKDHQVPTPSADPEGGPPGSEPRGTRVGSLVTTADLADGRDLARQGAPPCRRQWGRCDGASICDDCGRPAREHERVTDCEDCDDGDPCATPDPPGLPCGHPESAVAGDAEGPGGTRYCGACVAGDAALRATTPPTPLRAYLVEARSEALAHVGRHLVYAATHGLAITTARHQARTPGTGRSESVCLGAYDPPVLRARRFPQADARAAEATAAMVEQRAEVLRELVPQRDDASASSPPSTSRRAHAGGRRRPDGGDDGAPQQRHSGRASSSSADGRDGEGPGRPHDGGHGVPRGEHARGVAPCNDGDHSARAGQE